jgi:hypothetical protein
MSSPILAHSGDPVRHAGLATFAVVTRWRPTLTAALALLTTLLLLFATVSTWAHFDVLAPDALARHTRRTLQEPVVRDELATQITRRVSAADPRLAAAQPVVRRAAEILITSRQFADLVDIAVQQARRSVLEGDTASGSRLGDLEAQLRETLQVVDPSIAARVPSNWDTSVLDLSDDAAVPRTFRLADAIGRFWWISCVGAAIACIAWIASAFNRRRTVTIVGVAFGVVGAVLVVGRQIGGNAVDARVRGSRGSDAARAAYEVTTHGLHEIGVVYLAVAAVVLAATLTGSVIPAVVRGARMHTARALQLPAHAVARVAWSLGAIAAGVAVALSATRIGPALTVVVGVAVAFAGVQALVGALPSTTLPARSRVPRVSFALALVLATIGAAFLMDRGDDQPRGSAETQGTLVCNGHADLCERRVEEVTFGGTHNSMASADAGYAFAEQTYSIREQLDRGARLLMFDTHYGIPTSSGLVLTDLVFSDRAALVRRYGEATVASIEQLRSTVVASSAPSSVYLCHLFCELGATPASTAFAEIRRFLAENPSEVVFLMIQDETEGVDTVRSLTAAGLGDLAYAKPAGEPWPTLGTLVRDGTPLIVFSQREGGDPSWFLPAFSLVQDNPFTARSVDELSCAPNRGSVEAELFLLNHWIDKQTPDRADARQLNDRSFLIDQVRRCEAARERRVNLIAVDFMEQGDLVAAVDQLNSGEPP